MNHARRTEIVQIQDDFVLAWAEAQDSLDKLREKFGGLRDRVDSVKDEEEDSFNALNAGLQAAERGQKMEAAIEALQEVYATLDSFCTGIEDVASLPDDEVITNFDKAME